jgi:hypothetical protein
MQYEITLKLAKVYSMKIKLEADSPEEAIGQAEAVIENVGEGGLTPDEEFSPQLLHALEVVDSNGNITKHDYNEIVLYPDVYHVQVEKSYSDGTVLYGIIRVEGQGVGIEFVDKQISEGLQTNDSSILWDDEIPYGAEYDEFSFGTTGIVYAGETLPKHEYHVSHAI